MNSQKILLFRDAAETLNIIVHFEEGTFWLTQKAMSELFGVKVPAISKHLNNIFETNELNQNSVISILETTAADGKNYNTQFYRLEAILAVGYRVNSIQATDLASDSEPTKRTRCFSFGTKLALDSEYTKPT